jgi:hypothetical protein
MSLETENLDMLLAGRQLTTHQHALANKELANLKRSIEVYKEKSANAVKWAETERKGRERMRKLYAKKMYEETLTQERIER